SWWPRCCRTTASGRRCSGSEMGWYVYMLRCRDGSLYTGCTTDLVRRVAAHNAGTGAKYTRARRPVALVYAQPCRDHAAALRREAAIKKLPKGQKERLVLDFS